MKKQQAEQMEATARSSDVQQAVALRGVRQMLGDQGSLQGVAHAQTHVSSIPWPVLVFACCPKQQCSILTRPAQLVAFLSQSDTCEKLCTIPALLVCPAPGPPTFLPCKASPTQGLSRCFNINITLMSHLCHHNRSICDILPASAALVSNVGLHAARTAGRWRLAWHAGNALGAEQAALDGPARCHPHSHAACCPQGA